jgi:hypothetical protein
MTIAIIAAVVIAIVVLKMLFGVKEEDNTGYEDNPNN